MHACTGAVVRATQLTGESDKGTASSSEPSGLAAASSLAAVVAAAAAASSLSSPSRSSYYALAASERTRAKSRSVVGPAPAWGDTLQLCESKLAHVAEACGTHFGCMGVIEMGQGRGPSVREGGGVHLARKHHGSGGLLRTSRLPFLPPIRWVEPESVMIARRVG